jgi:hypothetical protein
MLSSSCSASAAQLLLPSSTLVTAAKLQVLRLIDPTSDSQHALCDHVGDIYNLLRIQDL